MTTAVLLISQERGQSGGAGDLMMQLMRPHIVISIALEKPSLDFATVRHVDGLNG